MVPIAHDSGGPKLDILKKDTTARHKAASSFESLEKDELASNETLGFLCGSLEDYVAALTRATQLSRKQRAELVSDCQRVAMERFSLSGFHQHFMAIVGPLIEKQHAVALDK